MNANNKESVLSALIPKLLHREFNEEFDSIMIDYMSEGTILGNLSRLSKYINMFNNQQINLQNNIEDFNDDENYTTWQFGDNDDE